MGIVFDSVLRPKPGFLGILLCTGNEINIGYLVEYIHDEMEPRISGLGWEKWVKKKRDHGFLARFRKPLIWNFIYFLACQAFAIGVALLMICPNLSYSQYLFGIDIISLFLTIVTLVIARFKRHGEGIS